MALMLPIISAQQIGVWRIPLMKTQTCHRSDAPGLILFPCSTSFLYRLNLTFSPVDIKRAPFRWISILIFECNYPILYPQSHTDPFPLIDTMKIMLGAAHTGFRAARAH